MSGGPSSLNQPSLTLKVTFHLIWLFFADSLLLPVADHFNHCSPDPALPWTKYSSQAQVACMMIILTRIYSLPCSSLPRIIPDLLPSTLPRRLFLLPRYVSRCQPLDPKLKSCLDPSKLCHSVPNVTLRASTGRTVR